MKPRPLGTILPRASDYVAADEYHKKTEQLRASVAAAKLSGLRRVVIGGESRYYSAPDKYAIVNSSGRVLWFEVRQDGDYSINGGV